MRMQNLAQNDILTSLRPAARWGCWLTLAALMLTVVVSAVTAAEPGDAASEDEPEKAAKIARPLELLERAPFFRMTLDAENDNAVLDIQPVEDLPANPKPTDRLRIRLVDDPEQLYEVEWRHITQLRTYAQLVYDEAQKLIRERKYGKAFRYVDFLWKNSSSSPSLARTINQYLLDNARWLIQQKQLPHGMAILEELHRRAPNFQQAEISKTMAEVADSLITDYVQKDDFRKARGTILRMKEQYPRLQITSLDTWQSKLISMATDLKQQAERDLAAGNLREAERRSRRMAAIWPELPGGRELVQQIATQYPMAIIGVAEVSARDDAASLDNWAARRTGPLVERTLLEFTGAGPEGGQYTCLLGHFEQSDDRRELILDVNPAGTVTGARVTGYDVARTFLNMGDPQSPSYLPAWAALVQGVRVDEVYEVRVSLRQPHVLPEAMLQIPLEVPARAELTPAEGPYMRAESPDDDTHLILNPRFGFPEGQPPSEIVERYFPTSQDALSAMRRGDIDAIDYLFPADVQSLQADKSLAVEPYALPTIHVLIPNFKNPFMASQTFRRALVYGINRESILSDELLGKMELDGFRVISGPFPVGTRDNDPLAYAYDASIAPRSYYPRLAAILRILAGRELKEIAQKRDEPVPELKPLVLGFPSNEVARVSCQAIAQYLQVIGIECQLRELPPGTASDPSDEVDLLYVQVAMWEPVIDARRLLAPAGIAAVSNEYVGMALRRLDAAKNWREARERLHELHRIVHEQVAVVPLWQTVNYSVRSRRLSGLGARPLTFYQNVVDWRLTAATAEPQPAAE